MQSIVSQWMENHLCRLSLLLGICCSVTHSPHQVLSVTERFHGGECSRCIGGGGCPPLTPKGSLVVVGAPVQLNSCLLTADQPAQTLLPCNRIKNKVNQSGKDGAILKWFEGPKVRAIFKDPAVISQNCYTGNSRAPAEVILRWGSKARQLGCCSRPAVL